MTSSRKSHIRKCNLVLHTTKNYIPTIDFVNKMFEFMAALHDYQLIGYSRHALPKRMAVSRKIGILPHFFSGI